MNTNSPKQIKFIQTITNQYDLWERYVSVFSEPHRYNWLGIKLYAIISTLTAIDSIEAQNLVKKYQQLYQRFLQNYSLINP